MLFIFYCERIVLNKKCLGTNHCIFYIHTIRTNWDAHFHLNNFAEITIVIKRISKDLVGGDPRSCNKNNESLRKADLGEKRKHCQNLTKTGYDGRLCQSCKMPWKKEVMPSQNKMN